MSELDDWATTQGHARLKPGSAHTWLGERPDLIEQVRDGRSALWGWDTITSWLADEHGCPFSESSVRSAGNRLGIR